MPFGVFERSINMLPVSGIIYKYHECYCCSAEHVERIITLFDHSSQIGLLNIRDRYVIIAASNYE